MIALTVIYGTVLALDCLAPSSAMVLAPLKEDAPLRLYHERPNELTYADKKSEDRQEEQDSKERRSTKGSSFIRFGRGGHPEGFRSPLRPRDLDGRLFERAARGDLKFIRFGRNARDLPFPCPGVLFGPTRFSSRLSRPCDFVDLGEEDADGSLDVVEDWVV